MMLSEPTAAFISHNPFLCLFECSHAHRLPSQPRCCVSLMTKMSSVYFRHSSCAYAADELDLLLSKITLDFVLGFTWVIDKKEAQTVCI